MTNYNILIVDDEFQNIQTITELLDNYPEYHFYTSTSGKLAYEIAKNEKIDIILSDWHMPKMSGLELIKCLKSDLKTKDIPIVMITGIMTSPESLQKAFDAGVVDFIRKPAEKIELVSRIKSVIKIFEYQKCEIIFKNQELATHAVYISKNNSFLINLLSQINELQATTPSKNKLLKNKINQIEINIESQTNDNSWKRFLYYFQQIHPNFEKSLIENHSDLKPSDVKLAIFLRLNLSSKEIAEIAFLQVNSVKTARYRLRKKLKLATGDNLNSYLLSY